MNTRYFLSFNFYLIKILSRNFVKMLENRMQSFFFIFILSFQMLIAKLFLNVLGSLLLKETEFYQLKKICRKNE